MRLYHGTSEAAALDAVVNGIRPRVDTGMKGNWDHTVASNPRLVYLSDCYAPYFALQAAYSATPFSEDARCAVIEIDTGHLRMDRLLPDEDFLEQATRGREEDQARLGLRGKTMQERTAWFRDNIWQFQSLWSESVQHLGNAAYAGTIPPEAITRAYSWSSTEVGQLVGMALDPTISVLNHALCASKYRTLTRCFMGERVDPRDLMSSAYHAMPDLTPSTDWDRLQKGLDECREALTSLI